MTQEHPITPPPELRRLWAQQAQRMDPRDPVAWQEHVATQAARWGADQELEACITWVAIESLQAAKELRVARRPKPPSLKEQALATFEEEPDDGKELLVFDTAQVNIIRRALEALPE